MEPVSVAIRTDLAWAHWAAVHDALAISQLTDIANRHPNFAVAQDCLAFIAFVQGDYAGYAKHSARFAELKQDPFLIERAQAVTMAIRAGEPALKKEMMRSEEHTSELQSLMRISYAVFCLKKKNNTQNIIKHTDT